VVGPEQGMGSTVAFIREAGGRCLEGGIGRRAKVGIKILTLVQLENKVGECFEASVEPDSVLWWCYNSDE
jgi:hypothetical protein